MERKTLEAYAKAIGVKPDDPGMDKAAEVLLGLHFNYAHLCGELTSHLTKPEDANLRMLGYFENALKEAEHWLYAETNQYGHTKVPEKLVSYLKTHSESLGKRVERHKPSPS